MTVPTAALEEVLRRTENRAARPQSSAAGEIEACDMERLRILTRAVLWNRRLTEDEESDEERLGCICPQPCWPCLQVCCVQPYQEVRNMPKFDLMDIGKG